MRAKYKERKEVGMTEICQCDQFDDCNRPRSRNTRLGQKKRG